MSSDLDYLVALGVPVEEIARRAGVQPQAIQQELNSSHQRREETAHGNQNTTSAPVRRAGHGSHRDVGEAP